MDDQLGLFGGGVAGAPREGESRAAGRGAPLPEGFRYQPDLITTTEEQALLEHVRALPFEAFQFRGYVGNRRIVSYGWRYDFSRNRAETVEDIPPFLLPLRDRAAEFAELTPDELQQALVTEYSPGAAIGWHRDKAVFGDVIGISLRSSCTFRMRRKMDDAWQRSSLTLEPRSAYLLRGPSRTEWEHSIPAVDALRYSVTFRNLRAR